MQDALRRIFAGRVLRVGSFATRTCIGGSQDQEHVAGPLGGLESSADHDDNLGPPSTGVKLRVGGGIPDA